MRCGIAAVVLLLLTGSFAGAGDWKRIGDENGMVVDSREVEGSSLHEVRVSTHADVPPSTVAAVIWRYQDHASFVPRLKHAEVLRDAGDERIVYEQLELPLVSNRDVVLRVHREVDKASGTIDIRSAAISDEGPAETSQFVRVRSSAGHWHLVPAGGGTDLTYVIRSDIGGSVPTWIKNRAQRDAVPDLVHAMVERARTEGNRSGR